MGAIVGGIIGALAVLVVIVVVIVVLLRRRNESRVDPGRDEPVVKRQTFSVADKEFVQDERTRGADDGAFIIENPVFNATMVWFIVTVLPECSESPVHLCNSSIGR